VREAPSACVRGLSWALSLFYLRFELFSSFVRLRFITVVHTFLPGSAPFVHIRRPCGGVRDTVDRCD